MQDQSQRFEEQRTFSDVHLRGGRGTFRLPPAYLIAYIPYAPFLAPSKGRPGSVFDTLKGLNRFPPPLSRHLAFRALFSTGNFAPPELFEQHDALLHFLDTKEFRGALWIRNATLTVSEFGSTLKFHWGTDVGFTPLRLPPPVGPFYSVGKIGSASYDLGEPAGGVITLKLWMSFKIGEFMDRLGAQFLTGARAPNVTVMMDYQFGNRGFIAVRQKGSSIPSSRLYSGDVATSSPRLVVRSSWDMLEASASEVNAFFGARPCNDAPVRYLP